MSLADDMRRAWCNTPLSADELRRVIARRRKQAAQGKDVTYNRTAAQVLSEILSRRV